MLRLRWNERSPDRVSPESAVPAPPDEAPWIDLCWWWEERSSGDAVPLRGDLLAARRYVAGFGARAELVSELRRFLREERPWTAMSPDDGAVIDHLAAALAAGQVHVVEALSGGREDEEAKAQPVAPTEAPVARPRVVPAEEPVAADEEPCWPCLQRAAASARAFRKAAAARSPFIEYG